MSLILQESDESISAKNAALRRELLRMTLAAGAVILSIMLVAPVVDLKPRIKAYKAANAMQTTKTEVASNQRSSVTEKVFMPETVVRKHRPHYFALEFHHKIE